MPTQYPKVKEDNEFPKCYRLSKIWNLLKIWLTKGFDSVATTLPELKPGQGVFPSDLQTFTYHLENMHNLDPKNREDTTLRT
jgi:hypothetical protein